MARFRLTPPQIKLPEYCRRAFCEYCRRAFDELAKQSSVGQRGRE